MPFDPQWMFNISGGHAVILFYVISGFLMAFVIEHKYSGPGGTRSFFKARALRIFPLWWAVFAFALAIQATAPTWLYAIGFVLFGSDWAVVVWNELYTFPSDTQVGWTLGAELSFYLIAPFVVRHKRMAVALLCASFALRFALMQAIPTSSPDFYRWTYFFSPATVMFFVLGTLAAPLATALRLGNMPAAAALLVAAFAISLAWPSFTLDAPLFYLSTLCFALALPGLFRATKDGKILGFLGDLTYPIYLIASLCSSMIFSDMPIVGLWGPRLLAAAHRWPTQAQGLVLGLGFAGTACVAAALVHFVVERPVIALARRALEAAGASRRTG